jgi:hypothetical protein
MALKDLSKPKKKKRKGPLVHVFVFDSGPLLQDESKYVTNIVKALLPEALNYTNVPVTFRLDEKLPNKIGMGRKPNLKRAMGYSQGWMHIMAKRSNLVEGIKLEREKFTFTWEEYHSDWGNRGIIYAFYKLI